MNQYPRRSRIYKIALPAALAFFTTAVGAQSIEMRKPMALRAAMVELGDDMQAVTAAISREEWAMVATLAPKIANHAEPPASEKMKILGWLGSDATKFRSIDGQVHDAAITMGEAARRNDGQAVIAAFARTQQGCLACHQGFRQSFVEHFYGNRK